MKDTHCHLGLSFNASAIIDACAEQDIQLWTMTVHPQDWSAESKRYRAGEDIRVGLGFHPWLVASGVLRDEDLDTFESHLGEADLVGEIGLDYGEAHGTRRDEQLHYFDRIISMAAQQGGLDISIHSHRSGSDVLDTIEKHALPSTCRIFLHSFMESQPDLDRALKLGCFIGVSPFMLNAKRGRDYIRKIPADRICLESDLTLEQSVTISADDYVKLMEETAQGIRELRA